MASSTIDNFAQALISEMGTLFASISAFPHRSLASFPPESLSALYVLYSPIGLPMRAGTISSNMGSRERSRLQQEVERLAANGFVASYRTLDLESDALVQAVAAWFMDLFESGLPLAGSTMAPALGGTKEDVAEETPARRRGRGSRKGATGKRGRPRKTAADGEPATDQPKRHRGRPRREAVIKEEEATAPRRRGRPRKSETSGSEGAARKRGRPRKEIAG